MLRGDYHMLVATGIKGPVVLHWGVSKSSPEDWLVRSLLPEFSDIYKEIFWEFLESSVWEIFVLASCRPLYQKSCLQNQNSLGACQTYFTEMSTGKGFFQAVNAK